MSFAAEFRDELTKIASTAASRYLAADPTGDRTRRLGPDLVAAMREGKIRSREAVIKPLGRGGSQQADLVLSPTFGVAVRKYLPDSRPDDRNVTKPAEGCRRKADMSLWSVFKEAATVEQLQAAYRRLRPVRTNTRPLNLNQLTNAADSVPIRPGSIGPSMLPTTAQAAAPLRTARRFYGRPDAKALLATTGIKPDWFDAVKEHGMQLAQAEAAAGRMPSAGKIFMPRGGAVRTFDRNRARLGTTDMLRLSPAGSRFINVAAGLHEGFERGVPARQTDLLFRGRFGHLSPRVLLNEHNSLVRGSGPGAADAWRMLRQVRGTIGDLTHVETNMVKPVFGARGLAYAQEHGYTPAMKRILNRRMLTGLSLPLPVSAMHPTWAAQTAPGHGIGT